MPERIFWSVLHDLVEYTVALQNIRHHFTLPKNVHARRLKSSSQKSACKTALMRFRKHGFELKHMNSILSSWMSLEGSAWVALTFLRPPWLQKKDEWQYHAWIWSLCGPSSLHYHANPYMIWAEQHTNFARNTVRHNPERFSIERTSPLETL